MCNVIPSTALVNYCSTPETCELVINGGFESNTMPPNYHGQLNNACNWTSGNETGGDYYRTDATSPVLPDNGDVHIPINEYGNQPVNNNIGNSYVGLIAGKFGYSPTVSLPGIKGSIATKLVEPLLPFTTYKLKFDASRGDYYGPNLVPLTLSLKLQMYLGYEPPSELNSSYGNLPIQVNGIFHENANFTSNNTTWDTIEYTFTTGSIAGQEYLYIGGLVDIAFKNDILDPNPPNSIAYYYLDNVSLKPSIIDAQFNLPAQLCINGSLNNLTTYLQNVSTTGYFQGNGVTMANGVYSFTAATAGLGIHQIKYIYQPPHGCDPLEIESFITVNENCPAPFISQTYFNGIDQYVEVKNPSATESIPYAEYFLALYANGASLNDVPTSSIKIPAMAPQEVIIFKNPATVIPAYASATAIVLLPNFICDSTNDIVVISKSENTTCYDDRVDFVGNNTSWGYKTSLVRTNCATSYPRIDLFDPEDWVEFTIDEVDSATAGTFVKTNAVLGRHNDDNLLFTTTGWNDGSSDESNPDRSREEVINASYSTAVNGSFEACSLDVNSILTITDSKYVSIQTSLNTTNGITNVNNNGALVMVKDQFHNIVGKDLTTGNVGVTRTTAGLDAVTDYVYWSSPIDDTILNSNDSVNNLFPSPPFITSRFYEYRNAYFQDIPDVWYYPNNANGANGYDDDLNDYHILDAGQRAQQMTAGLGYLTWAKSSCGSTCNYDINFNGKPNNGVVTVPVYHNAPSNAYPNLIGNPYPSAIDLNRLFAVNAGLIDPVAYVWGRAISDTPSSDNSGPYVINYKKDNYIIYNQSMPYLPGSFGHILSSCQSFFVNTPTYGGNLIFNNSMRTKLPNNTFAKNTTEETKDLMYLSITNEKLNAQLGIAFLDKATDAFNSKEDVRALLGRTLNFYSKTKEEDLIVNALNTFTIEKVMPLGITSIEDQDEAYTISIDKTTGAIKGQVIYLEDKLKGIIHNLSESSYTFKLNSKIVDDRFVLRFKDSKSKAYDTKNYDIDVIANLEGVTVNSLNKNIKSIMIIDIYTPAINGQEIEKADYINAKQATICIDEKYKLLLIKVILEDGSIITKKIMR